MLTDGLSLYDLILNGTVSVPVTVNPSKELFKIELQFRVVIEEIGDLKWDCELKMFNMGINDFAMIEI